MNPTHAVTISDDGNRAYLAAVGAQPDVHRRPGRRVDPGVVQEVVDDLTQPCLVADHLGRADRLDVDRPLGIHGPRAFDGIGEHRSEVDGLPQEGPPLVQTRQEQQVVHEDPHPGGLRFDPRHRLLEILGPRSRTSATNFAASSASFAYQKKG